MAQAAQHVSAGLHSNVEENKVAERHAPEVAERGMGQAAQHVSAGLHLLAAHPVALVRSLHTQTWRDNPLNKCDVVSLHCVHAHAVQGVCDWIAWSPNTPNMTNDLRHDLILQPESTRQVAGTKRAPYNHPENEIRKP